MIHMDMNHRPQRAPEFNALPSTGATVIFGTEGWIFVSRDGIVTNPAPLAAREDRSPIRYRSVRSPDHRRNLLEAIRTDRKTICPIESAVRASKRGAARNNSSR
jgi:hypothetical protein